VTYVCFFNLTPVYPQVAQDLGLDAGSLGALVGIGGIVALLVQVPAGSSGDRWGRRPFFALAMLLLVASQLARWQATAPPILLASQVLGGAAQGIATVNAWALVADATSSQKSGQGQAFGILNAALALGLVTGYLIAGGVGGLIGWRSMSLVLIVFPVLALPALNWIPRRGAATVAERPGLATLLRSVAHKQRLALAVMAGLTLGAGQGALYLLPFGLQQRDLGPFTAALLLVPYVVGSVIAGPLAGRLIDRVGTRPVLVGLLTMGGVATVGLVWGARSTLGVILLFTLVGASVNGALPLMAVRAVELGDASGVGRGSIIAGLRMGQSSGTFLGPAIAGSMLAHAGLTSAWLAQALFLVASLAIYEGVTRESHPLAAPVRTL